MDDDESQAASSDNDNDNEIDVDETMDDVEEDVDADVDVDNEDDNEDNDNEEDYDQDDGPDHPNDSPIRSQSAVPRALEHSSLNGATRPNGQRAETRRNSTGSHSSGTDDQRQRPKSIVRTPPRREAAAPFRPSLRPEALSAVVYDIVPTIAAPHSTSINSITATPDMRWVFSGGSDGWVRKFNWVETANSKSMLTVAQRHPFVDSVTKAGVLVSYWENEDTIDGLNNNQTSEEGPSLSPVYSLAVQHQALWLLSGTELGAINLQSIRHEEGKRITSLRQHSSAVSVMVLSQDERSLLSGSWDKTILDWDLNVGRTKRNFLGSGSQISAIELRPLSSIPIPRDIAEKPPSDSFTSSGANDRLARASTSNETREVDDKIGAEEPPVSPDGSLFGDSLFGDDATAGTGVTFDQDTDFGFSGTMSGDVGESMDTTGSTIIPDSDGVQDAGQKSSESGLDGSSLVDQDTIMQKEEKRLPSSEDIIVTPTTQFSTEKEPEQTSESTFLDAAIDGTLRIWDRRQLKPVARILPQRSVPPWCMHACWSHDGNYIYAGRRNGTVEEYSMHKGLREPQRTLRFPSGSGAVSAVRAMPNGKHVVCASFDILRLYDLKDEESAKHSKVPFLIVPGHRTGVVSQLYIDSTCSFMISTGGNRGWEGNSTEVLLGYEIGIGR